MRIGYFLIGLIFLFPIYGYGEEQTSKNTFTVRATWFDRGNVYSTQEYGTVPCIIGSPGVNQVEYDLDFPESGKYRLEFLYSARDSRPSFISIGKESWGEFLGQKTGDWDTKTAQWELIAEKTIAAGKQTLAIRRDSPIPHLVAFRFTPLFSMNTKWNLPRPIAIKNTKKEETPIWNSAWFFPVSRDRAAKKESGKTFEKHFARETAIALVDHQSISFQINRDPVQKIEFDLCNETTYRPGIFDTTTSDPDSVKIDVLYHPKNDAAKSLLDPKTTFTLSLDRYRLLLDKTSELRNRLYDTFGAEELKTTTLSTAELAAIPIDLKKRKDRLPTWQKCFKDLPKMSQEDRERKELEFAKEFFDLVRIYSRLGLSNPLLDFDNILYVRRDMKHNGLMQNYQSNAVLNPAHYHDRLCRLKLSMSPENVPFESETVYAPQKPAFIGDVDLSFDARKLLFSSTNEKGKWNVFELDLNRNDPSDRLTGSTSKALLPDLPEAHSYDACYLPDDSILFTSTACYTAVPCLNGGEPITNIYRQYNDPEKTIRRLTFDQEHNWCPVMMEDGRVLYLRWEYTDVPHVFARLLFLMNPDGTGQTSFYGSNSYWPNSMFYTRPIPGEPTRFITVVGGHHGVGRMGELVLFDVKKGRTETEGAIQRICAADRIVASSKNPKYEDTLIVDNLVDETWPKFVHPYPLSSDYHLVSGQVSRSSTWGIYLVDTDDNMILLSRENGYAHFEPIPLKKTPRPPVLADRVDLTKNDATIFLADIYLGDGLKNVPRGTVKKLRVFTYNYLFPQIGGPQGTVGAEGPWDIREIIGTVPVNENGAAMFNVPANTPIAIQPIDEHGKELQLMRSWFTAMPGEILSCIGCHEDKNSVSPSQFDSSLINRMKPQKIVPWFGDRRGFSFSREVQPVLDRYCISCHNGESGEYNSFDLRGDQMITDYSSVYHRGIRSGGWSVGYDMLHRYVRRPGLESDYHLLMPTEFSAETTDLYRTLVKGHYGVQLDAESWNRLITWIDLNAPYHGYWSEQANQNTVSHWNKRRKTVLELYKSTMNDQEQIRAITFDSQKAAFTHKTDHGTIPGNPFDGEKEKGKRIPEKSEFPDGNRIKANFKPYSKTNVLDLNWTFSSEEAQKRQQDAAVQLFGDCKKTSMKIELAPGLFHEMRLIPAGTFIMGAQSKDPNGKILQKYDDEQACIVHIEKPFWMSTREITNREFELFDPDHDSRVESRYAMQFGVRGFHVNEPEKSVVRVSWNRANDFSQWISKRSKLDLSLPTESQWEYACRAGTGSPFHYGDLNTDFAPFANLADATLREFVCHPYFKERKPLGGSKYDQWLPRIDTVNDSGFLSEAPGRYKANAWGLFDMHGNVAEWTLSLAKAYPYQDKDGRNDLKANGERVVRGGSWRDRPINARSEFRSSYRPWQGVFNVGFRLVCPCNELKKEGK